MGRIIGYQYDDNVQDGDAWIGSEDGGGRTKQYTAEAVANYLNIQGKISIVGQMTYKYGITPLSGPGTFAVFGGGTDPVAFSAITKLTLSNTDVSKQRVVEFLNLLVGSDILISKQSAISTFGYYSIDSYAVNATDPAYYDLGVTFKSGNGSMEAEQIYETQNFTLAAEENISTLQTTIDSGNTYQANPSNPLWTWGPGEITTTSTSFTSLLSSKRFKTTLIADGSYTDVLPNQLIFNNALGNETSITPNTALSSNIDLQWPSSSGILALTTDITASPWDTVTGGINYANGNVGIGTTTPSAKLDVNGDALINGLTVGQGAGTSAFGNTVFGKTALNNITTGLRNVAIGNEALLDNTVGNYNIALGYRSLENNSANNNVAIGVEALQRVETAGNNTAVGRYTLGLTSGAGNTAIGYAAGYLRVGGTNGNSIDSVFIGSLTKSNGLTSENEIVIGTGAESAGSNTVVLGNDDIVSTRLKGDVIVANGNVGIGTTSPVSKLELQDGTFTVDNGNINVIAGGISATRNSANNTGLVVNQQGTADILNLLDNGTEVLTVIDGGNVGIGTTSPGSKLHVSSVSSNSQLTLERTGTFTGKYTMHTASNNFYIGNSAASTYPLTILNSGNVGIGTTSPAYKLEVSGNAALSIGADRYLRIGSSTNYWWDLQSVSNDFTLKEAGSNTRLIVKAGGNVGIGTTSPSNVLTIGTDSTAKGIDFYAGSTRLGSIERMTIGSAVSIGLEGANGRPVSINNNHSSQVIIANGGGNVGIGTTSPAYKLDVAGTIRVGSGGSIQPLLSRDSTTGGLVVSSVGNSGDFIFLGTGGSEKFRITDNGNVGIGTTSPGAKLEISETGTTGAALYVDTARYGIAVVGDGTSNSQYLLNLQGNGGSTNAMAVQSSGNVGIGTTAPSQKLEVDGQVLSDGYRLAAMQTAPATRNSTGTLGEIVIDGNHIYVCYATDSWSRVALETSW